jgi:hypothetical protein
VVNRNARDFRNIELARCFPHRMAMEDLTFGRDHDRHANFKLADARCQAFDFRWIRTADAPFLSI